MPLNKEARVHKIQEIINKDSKSSKRISYEKETKEMPSYNIPVEYLIFNQYNGRIGTFVKTYEKQVSKIDASTEEGENLIVDFLWKSKEQRNKETLKDISDKGQLEIGIITKDGVIIDGNRRCMLLKKIAEKEHSNPTYFHAVVLSDELNDNPREIRKLETIHQMGVDQPVDYNAIEKYLKCKELSGEDGFTNDEIANFMGEKSAKIKEYLSILQLMEEYLSIYDCEGMYTKLSEEKVEGPFVDLRNYLEKQKKGSKHRDWQPAKDNLDDLKNIYFDYIRAGFGSHDGTREIGKGLFNHKKLWDSFATTHAEKIEPINEKEKTLEKLKQERPNESIDNLIRSKDADWKAKAESSLKKNLGKSKRDLEDLNEASTPMILLSRALSSLNAITKDSDSIEGEDIKNISHSIRKIVEGFIKTVEQKAKIK